MTVRCLVIYNTRFPWHFPKIISSRIWTSFRSPCLMSLKQLHLMLITHTKFHCTVLNKNCGSCLLHKLWHSPTNLPYDDYVIHVPSLNFVSTGRIIKKTTTEITSLPLYIKNITIHTVLKMCGNLWVCLPSSLQERLDSIDLFIATNTYSAQTQFKIPHIIKLVPVNLFLDKCFCLFKRLYKRILNIKIILHI